MNEEKWHQETTPFSVSDGSSCMNEVRWQETTPFSVSDGSAVALKPCRVSGKKSMEASSCLPTYLPTGRTLRPL